jgi:V/A-type H+-transporting ATPase subunit I
MHLIPLTDVEEQPEAVPSGEADKVREAWAYLMESPRKRKPVRDRRDFHLPTVVQATLAHKRRLREVEDRRDFLAQRVAQLAPWGNFQLPGDTLGGHRFWFYRLPHNKLNAVDRLELPWQQVYEDSRFTYIAVISPEEPPPDALPVLRTHTGSVPLEELERQLENAEVELEDLTAEYESLSRWIYLLSENLARTEDRSALTQAGKLTLDNSGIFALQGWVPTRQTQALEAFAEQHGLALATEAAGPEDAPPTLMENPDMLAGGQDLVSFYQTPDYHDWDPSIVVFFSFALFFAMITADAGYALLLAIPVLYSWQRLGKTKSGRNFRLLAVWVLGISLIYGVLAGSYFGLSPKPDSLLGQVDILEIEDAQIMMPLSVIVGCLHIILGNAIAAIRAHDFAGRAKHMGWIAVVLGGLLLLGAGENSPAMLHTWGIGLLLAGFAAIVFLSSHRPLNSVPSFGLRLVDGLFSLTHITSMFGDVLSYLRLFALGLASASLAITFNQLAGTVSQAAPGGVGLVLSLAILIVGHSINLVLAIISGFVHGLRLNFIEFFRWALSDAGYPFQAFAKKEIDDG